MNEIVAIGEHTLSNTELIELLHQYRLWPKLVREFLIDRAIADQPYSPEEVQQASEDFFNQHKIPPDNRTQWLQAQGLSPAELQTQLARQIRLQKFKTATWGHQLESFFLKQKSYLDRVTYSLIRTKDQGIAQELYCRLIEKEADFAELAQQYSEGSEAQTGGRIGPVALTVPHPNLARMLSISEPGQLWPPHPLNDWYLIVRLDEMHPARLDPPTQAQLLNQLFEQWIAQQLDQNPVRFHSPLAQ